jgi:hypothetical protein
VNALLTKYSTTTSYILKESELKMPSNPITRSTTLGCKVRDSEVLLGQSESSNLRKWGNVGYIERHPFAARETDEMMINNNNNNNTFDLELHPDIALVVEPIDYDDIEERLPFVARDDDDESTQVTTRYDPFDDWYYSDDDFLADTEIIVRDKDVLVVGQSPILQNHPGNVQFRELMQ